MGVKEKIEELRASQRTEEENDRQREEEKEKIRSERFSKELPEAMTEQRKLFEELREVGIIAMLEEMTYPQEIQSLQTLEERTASTEEIAGRLIDAKASSEPSTDSDPYKVLDDLRNQEWRASVMYPEQFGDGSLNKSRLVIEVNNDTMRRKTASRLRRGRLKTIELSYYRPSPHSEESRLIIRGERTTYEGGVNAENIETIEMGLAEAFLKPRKE